MLDYDTAVSYTAPLISRLKTRGHTVDVLVFADDPNTTRELRRLGLDYGVLEMPIADPGRYDLAVCMCDKQVRDCLMEHGVYTCVLLLSMSPRTKGDAAEAYCECDLMVVAGEHIEEELVACGCFGEIITAGIPRYDGIFGRQVTDEQFFLYADVGRHPAEREQRKEMLARLCHVAEEFPEYSVVIKPRYTHQTRDVTAHYHGEDYYHLLREHGRVPENVRVLEEHVDLEDLVCRCSVLICFPSTCVLSAMLLEKPVLVLKGGGFNEDPPPHETFGVCSNYPYFRESGCLIDVDTLVDHLPGGLLADAEFVRREVRDFDGRATDRVADILEAVWRTIKQTTPRLPVMGLTTENYEERLETFVKGYQNGSPPCHRVERHYLCNRNKSILATKINVMINQSSLPHLFFKDLIPFLTGWIETSMDLPIQDRELNRLQRQTISEIEHRLRNEWGDFHIKSQTGFEDLLVHVWLAILIGDTANFKRWPQWSAIDFSTYLRNLVEHHAQDGWWPVYLLALSITDKGAMEQGLVNLATKSPPESIARPAYGCWLCLANEFIQTDGSGVLPQTLAAEYFVRCLTTCSVRFVVGLDLFSQEARARLDAMEIAEQRKALARHVSTVPLKDQTDRYRRGSIFQWLACLDQAENDFQSILAGDDTRRLHPGALYHLGEIYRQQGRFDQACEALGHCLTLQEDHRAAAALLGEVAQRRVGEKTNIHGRRMS